MSTYSTRPQTTDVCYNVTRVAYFTDMWFKCKSIGEGTVPAHLGPLLVVEALVESCGPPLGVCYAVKCIRNSGQKGTKPCNDLIHSIAG